MPLSESVKRRIAKRKLAELKKKHAKLEEDQNWQEAISEASEGPSRIEEN